MATHDLKVWPKSFEAIWRCKKHHHEVLNNDADFHEGDWLVLREWDTDDERYTGRGVRVIVTHIARESFVGTCVCMLMLSFVHVNEKTGKWCCGAVESLEERDTLVRTGKTFGEVAK